MARNVEIKARVADFAAVRSRAVELADGPPAVLRQEDTFFCVSSNRLKLRAVAGRPGELIAYERPDTSGPKRCEYEIFRTEDVEGLKRTLTRALGVRGVVRKERQLFMRGSTRVHLDRVDGLGDFLEIEVVLGASDSVEAGREAAEGLMRDLGVSPADLVDRAYIDLIERRAGAAPA